MQLKDCVFDSYIFANGAFPCFSLNHNILTYMYGVLLRSFSFSCHERNEASICHWMHSAYMIKCKLFLEKN